MTLIQDQAGVELIENNTGNFSRAEFFHALRIVETGDKEKPKDGDNGKAIGPYQIHREYWSDALTCGAFEKCRERVYAEGVICRYMNRFHGPVKEFIGEEKCVEFARIHNGGPNGHRKAATLKYGEKFRVALRKLRA